jgi:hypothetical protein
MADPVMCDCDQEAVRQTCVNPNNPNRGREFFTCALRACKFFLPVDGKPWEKAGWPASRAPTVRQDGAGAFATRFGLGKKRPAPTADTHEGRPPHKKAESSEFDEVKTKAVTLIEACREMETAAKLLDMAAATNARSHTILERLEAVMARLCPCKTGDPTPPTSPEFLPVHSRVSDDIDEVDEPVVLKRVKKMGARLYEVKSAPAPRASNLPPEEPTGPAPKAPC